MAGPAVIFDLDGTLLDTLDDLAAAGNCALAEAGFPAHPVERYRTLVGSGVTELFRRAVAPAAAPAALINHGDNSVCFRFWMGDYQRGGPPGLC